MTKTYYEKRQKKNIKILFRALALVMVGAGFLLIAYIFFPLLSWQIYFAPVFASQNVASPLPHSTTVSGSALCSLVSSAVQSFFGVDIDNTKKWYTRKNVLPEAAHPKSLCTLSQFLSNIQSALVSTVDNNLAAHL